MSSASKAKRQASNLTRETKPWVIFLARLGYVAKGIVYGVIGILAFQAAFGVGSTNIDTNQALIKIVTQPFGRILLWIVAIGLIGYVLWMFVQAILDPENNGTDAKGLLQRTAYFVSGIGYALVDFSAFQILTGSGGGNSGQGPQDWTAKVMSNPAGRWFIGLVGLGLGIWGLVQIYQAYSKSFTRRLKMGDMNGMEKTWAVRTGQAGLTARGIVFGIIAYFLVQAAITYDPAKAGGLGQAFQALARQPFGPWLLGIVAIGLIAYGIYSLFMARYRRIYF